MNHVFLTEEQKFLKEYLLKNNKFDAQYYIKKYPDVLMAGIDPLDHYILYGASEHRNPAEWFDTAYYLEHNDDVKLSGVNPFYHYLSAGLKEYRFTNPSLAKLGELSIQAEKYKCNQKYNDAIKVYEELLNNCPNYGVPLFIWLNSLGECYITLNKWAEAVKIFQKACEICHDNANVYAYIAKSLQRLGRWWQAAEAWEKAINLNANNAEWWFEKGKAEECMKRWDSASDAYEKAIELNDQFAEWHYRLGYAREKCGRAILAEEAYQEAIFRDKALDASQLGIGVFHANRSLWDDAVKAYERTIRLDPGLNGAKFQSKLAFAYHRNYDFEKACAANLSVLAFCSHQMQTSKELRADALYRLGIALERMGGYEKAAVAYKDSLKIKFNAYRCYRLAYALACAGNYKEACSAYLRMNHDGSLTIGDMEGKYVRMFADNNISQCRSRLSEDATRVEDYLLLGYWLEQINDVDGAIRVYSSGASRLNNHDPRVWFNLGRTIFLKKKYEDACSAFANLEILREPYFVDRNFYDKNLWFKHKVDYTEYCKHLSISENVILYENMHGVGIGDSPYALFLKIYNHSCYKNWIHVWSIAHENYIPSELKSLPNVIFILRDSDGFLRYLATAKVLINNVTWPEFFIRRNEQIYLNTWHGTPMKTLGRDIKSNPYETNNIARNFLQATHLAHSNKFTENILLSRFSIKSICSEKSAVTGYPRIDLSLNLGEAEKLSLRRKLGIPDGKKILLYAPTWRGAKVARNEVDNSLEMIQSAIEACNELQNYVVVFRGHQAIERFVNHFPSCLVAMQTIPTNHLLAITDILMTDYSSIAFDYMALKRPIIYFCPDIDKYRRERGFYVEPHELPGYYCDSIDKLNMIIKNIENIIVPNINHPAYDKYCSKDDGFSSMRIIENLLLKENPIQNKQKKNILVFMDLFKNGIGMSALALCELLINNNKYNIYVMINMDIINSNPDMLTVLEQLPEECNIIVNNRTMNMTLEEFSLQTRYDAQKKFCNEIDKEIYANMYKREFKRLFGDTQFDALIDFSGYSPYIVDLFAFAENQGTKIIWLHSDMKREMKARFPYFERIFKAYRYFDKCISVSQKLSQINMNNLAEDYGIGREKFVFCPNVQRPYAVCEMAKEALANGDAAIFSDNHKVFINIARLSPEKNQIMLIHAFSKVNNIYPETRLLIVGKGPSEHSLREAISALNLEQNVFVVGFRDNPYSLLAHSDCLVTASIYEGQPVTLFEAMALHKPIIASDIPAHREIIGGNLHGWLAENSIDGLAAGMELYLLGKVPTNDFDFNSHNSRALAILDSFLREN